MFFEKIKNDIILFAKQHNVPCISSATEEFLLQHLMKYKPVFCCEVGSAIGLSTLTMANTLSQRGGSLTSFEISHPSYMHAINNLYQANISNAILYHHSVLEAPLDKILPPQLDFIFLDGQKNEYGRYLKALSPYTHPNTTIICDDVSLYQDKVDHIYPVIQELGLSYNKYYLSDGDAVLLVSSHASPKT